MQTKAIVWSADADKMLSTKQHVITAYPDYEHIILSCCKLLKIKSRQVWINIPAILKMASEALIQQQEYISQAKL